VRSTLTRISSFNAVRAPRSITAPGIDLITGFAFVAFAF
jgi:hypothetical protein